MNQSAENSRMQEQLEIAIRALHIIAVMGELEAKQISQIALDALREMETYGILYDIFDDEEDDFLWD